MTTIPIVTEETAMGVIAELFVEEAETSDGSGLVIDWIRAIGKENPELVRTITWFASLYGDEAIRSAFFAAMAITYRAISAQAQTAAPAHVAQAVVIQ